MIITDLALRSVYRIVWQSPPTVDDFRSAAELGGQSQVSDLEIMRLSTGISVFRTEAQARRLAMRRPPWFGRGYIARIDLPERGEFRIERTTRSAGHYTLWAPAEMLFGWSIVVDIVSRNDGGVS